MKGRDTVSWQLHGKAKDIPQGLKMKERKVELVRGEKR
jgi:hypothetical protein